VDEVQAVEQLVHDFLDFTQTELDVDVGQQARQVVLAELEHKEERAFVAVELGRCNSKF
jgi:hypothetical protein